MTKHKPQLHRYFNKPPLCEGKYCYAHKAEAEAVKSEQEILQPGLLLNTYRCLNCRMWHLTRVSENASEF